MKKMKNILTVIIGFLIIYGCIPEDLPNPCENITCYNGGVCHEGDCICFDDYTGRLCQNSPSSGSSGNTAGAGDNGNSGSDSGGGAREICDLQNSSSGWVSPDGENYEAEAERELPNNFYLSGIGLRVDNDELRTVILRGRELKDDCTFGPVTEYRGGLNSSSTPERMVNLQNGLAITGIGFSVTNDNVSALTVRFRGIIEDSDGGYKLGNEATQTDGAGNIEKLLSTSDFSSLDIEKAVITKVSGVVYNDNAHELELDFSHFDVN